MNWKANETLAGSRAMLRAMESGEDPAKIEAAFAADTEAFRVRRAKFLLYP
jgi:hypothetical protein